LCSSITPASAEREAGALLAQLEAELGAARAGGVDDAVLVVVVGWWEEGRLICTATSRAYFPEQ